MIVIISNPAPIKDEHYIIRQLFNSGLELFHLRKKELNENQLKAFIEAIPEEHYDKIVLHSNYHLAAEYSLRGIHVPYTYDGEAEERPLSISFHSLEEINEFRLSYNYGFLSPIFDSISKEGYKSSFDLNEVKQFFKKQEHKIIALGGIDEDRIETVKDLGFSGVALLGAIWQSEHPVEKFKQIKEQWLK